jgi:hypothetical protein
MYEVLNGEICQGNIQMSMRIIAAKLTLTPVQENDLSQHHPA